MQAPDIHLEFNPTGGGSVTIRTIRPDDARIEQEFVRRLSPRSRRLRFMAAMRELTPSALDKFVHVNYPQEMALIATTSEHGVEREIGVARYAQDPDGGAAEFAVVVADDWQGRGVGPELLRQLFEVAASSGVASMQGVVLRENQGMLRLARALGFSVETCREDVGLFRIYKNFGQ